MPHADYDNRRRDSLIWFIEWIKYIIWPLKVNKKDHQGWYSWLPITLKQAGDWKVKPCSLQRHFKRWRPLMLVCQRMEQGQGFQTNLCHWRRHKIASILHQGVLITTLLMAFAPQHSLTAALPAAAPAQVTIPVSWWYQVSPPCNVKSANGWTSGFTPCHLKCDWFLAVQAVLYQCS